MKNKFFLLLLATLFSLSISAQETVERWGMYETTLKAHTSGNPFKTELTATFTCKGKKYEIPGFYDGNDTFVIRFMPTELGKWTYTTHSSLKALNGKKGEILCVAPSKDNHGPVVTDGEFAFKYADGTRYYPIGTTSYDWMHAVDCNGNRLEQQTLESLKESRFNKIRQLLLPHNFEASYPEPDLFPYEMKNKSVDKNGKTVYTWDFTRPNPEFFRMVERCVQGLMDLGIEADMCIFHPYDEGRWGFDSMPLDVSVEYVKYVVKRLAAYRNIWWSLANEYDLMRNQPKENWTHYIGAVVDTDPYHHLTSIHSYTAQYYPYWDERLTHCSIQDQAPVEDFGRAPIVRNIYHKPVIFDEVCYEGDMNARWGNLSGEEILFRMWMGLINGTYVTHAECYQAGDDHDFYNDFLAVGGKWQGEAWKRIGFMRDVLADLPMPMYLADSSWDPRTTAAGPGYYMIYLGKEVKEEWRFDLPIRNGRGAGAFPRLTEGEQYTVEIIDTWGMTIKKVPGIFTLKKQDGYRMVDSELRSIRLPQLPYLLLRIKRVE